MGAIGGVIGAALALAGVWLFAARPDLAPLARRAAAVEASVDAANARVSALETQSRAAAAERQALADKLKTVDAALSDAEAKLAGRIAALEAAGDKAAAERKAAADSAADLRSSTDALSRDLAAERDKAAAERKSLADEVSQLKGASTDAETLEKRLDALENAVLRSDSLAPVAADARAAKDAADRALAASAEPKADPRLDRLASDQAEFARKLAADNGRDRGAAGAPRQVRRAEGRNPRQPVRAAATNDTSPAARAVAAMALQRRFEAGEPLAAELAALDRLGVEACGAGASAAVRRNRRADAGGARPLADRGSRPSRPAAGIRRLRRRGAAIARRNAGTGEGPQGRRKSRRRRYRRLSRIEDAARRRRSRRARLPPSPTCRPPRRRRRDAGARAPRRGSRRARPPRRSSAARSPISARGDEGMLRLLAFLAVLGLAAWGLSWLADNPGAVSLTWRGVEYNVSLMVALGVVLAAARRAVAGLRAAALRAARPGAGLARGARAAAREGLCGAVARHDRRRRGRRARGASLRARGRPLLRRRIADEAAARAGRAALAATARARSPPSTTCWRATTRICWACAACMSRRAAPAQPEAALDYARRAYARAAPPWAAQAVLDDFSARGDWANALATVETNAAARPHRPPDRQPLARGAEDRARRRARRPRPQGRAGARPRGARPRARASSRPP